MQYHKNSIDTFYSLIKLWITKGYEAGQIALILNIYNFEITVLKKYLSMQ